MATKDYRHRETKKPKKDSKKTAPIIFETPAEVEVIKKVRKPKSEEEEE